MAFLVHRSLYHVFLDQELVFFPPQFFLLYNGPWSDFFAIPNKTTYGLYAVLSI